jgi:hypothetical protein
MVETIVCPSFRVAKALARLSTFYAIWDKNQRHQFAPIRSTALFAKAQGLVIHDRTLNFDQGRF